MGPFIDLACADRRSPGDAILGQLEQVRRRSHVAYRMADECASTTPRELERILTQVEDILGTIACDERLDAGVTATLRSVRDELTSHLVAAAGLEAIELPRAAVVDVLRRAAATTEKGLKAVSTRP